MLAPGCGAGTASQPVVATTSTTLSEAAQLAQRGCSGLRAYYNRQPSPLPAGESLTVDMFKASRLDPHYLALYDALVQHDSAQTPPQAQAGYDATITACLNATGIDVSRRSQPTPHDRGGHQHDGTVRPAVCDDRPA